MDRRNRAQYEAHDRTACKPVRAAIRKPHEREPKELSAPMYMIHLKAIGWIRPPSWKHWIHKAKARPPHAPMKNLVAFQKKMESPPPTTPATAQASTNMPRMVGDGGFTAGSTPKRRISTRQTMDSVYHPIRKNEVLGGQRVMRTMCTTV